MSNISSSVSAFVVRHVDGSVNYDETMSNFGAALSHFIETKDREDSMIAEAVSAVFDNYPGAAIAMPALVSAVLSALNAAPTDYATLSVKIADYVRSQSGEYGSAVLCIQKGKGGGVFRWADCGSERVERAQARAAKAAR